VTPISVTPHLGPPVVVTLVLPGPAGRLLAWSLEFPEAEQLALDLAAAVKLLRYHVDRQRGGRATKGLSTDTKRTSSTANLVKARTARAAKRQRSQP